MGRRVLKFDGAFGPEGCGIALSGDAYKVSVTGLAFCVIWHDTHAGDWLTAFATKGDTAEWYMKYMTLCFSSPYFSFPLEGNSRAAGKGVRGKAPI